MMRLALRAAAFLLMAAVLLLSVVPPGWRPVTSAPHTLEHLVVFVLIGATLVLAFPGRLVACLTVLVLFAGAVETVQLWVPGRHARVTDFVVHLVAIALGLGIAWLATRFVPRLRAQ